MERDNKKPAKNNPDWLTDLALKNHADSTREKRTAEIAAKLRERRNERWNKAGVIIAAVALAVAIAALLIR